MRTQIFAHRGASCTAPENTLPAFEKAVEAHADGVVLDVHLTADGVPVVIHDDTVNRTTGEIGTVNEMTLEQLRGLDASMGRGGYAGAGIPTLEEVYRLLQPSRLQVNVQVMDYTVQAGCYVVLPKILELAERFRMKERVFYSSFHHCLLRALKQFAPQVHTAALYSGVLVNAWDYAKTVPVDAIHPNFATLQDKSLMAQCHTHGLAVRPWTVNQGADLFCMFRQGTDAVITDDPALAFRMREQFKCASSGY